MLAVAALTFALTSPAFHAGGAIPARYTCSGADVSPPLRWVHTPGGTRAFALRLDDPDAPGGTFTHWTAWNLSQRTTSLPAGAHPPVEGRNSFGRVGYGGPCPPAGPAHHYVFTVYALKGKLPLARGATTAQFAAALRGHVLRVARLVGTYRR